MRIRYKIFFSRLLVLIMLISSFQGALAIDFSQNMHEQESSPVQLLLADADDMGVGNGHLMGHHQGNVSHNNCDAQCYVSFFYVPDVTPLVTRSRIRQKIATNSSAIPDRFPNLLIRPPKI